MAAQYLREWLNAPIYHIGCCFHADKTLRSQQSPGVRVILNTSHVVGVSLNDLFL